ncbi:hypothetical protein GRO01_10040 [Gluconobacter roseus NBRC 3990]|uniref:Uncharacterized protein n=1 Tax=Gluconobacter roseus NBRC 3990 TaxID=1307950 RepID=A0A4Y3M7H2_9PROT|nr:hypothetical protein GRO01_10040 [Gluconobacter roseus NBRC 3990]
MRNRIVPTAQLNRMISGFGNSGANIEPEESLLQNWNCDATMTKTATRSFTATGRGKGHNQFRITIDRSRPNTIMRTSMDILMERGSRRLTVAVGVPGTAVSLC